MPHSHTSLRIRIGAVAACLIAALLAGCFSTTGEAEAAADGFQTLGPVEAPTKRIVPSSVPTPQEHADPFLTAVIETPEPANEPDPEPAFELIEELAPELNASVGWVRIPKAEVDWPLIEGVNPEQLDISPGHMPRTPMPGQWGNAVLAGHRTTFGSPFYHLDRLEPGDEIYVDTEIGTHTYEVVSTEIVLPTAMWTVQHRDGGWLTLISCHPKGSNAQRIIIFARLIDGPNADAIEAMYSGPYDPPTDPEATE